MMCPVTRGWKSIMSFILLLNCLICRLAIIITRVINYHKLWMIMKMSSDMNLLTLWCLYR